MSTRENKPGSIPPVNRNGRRNITQVRGYVEDDTSPVPLNPYIRTGLYNLATGQNVTPLLGSGKINLVPFLIIFFSRNKISFLKCQGKTK